MHAINLKKNIMRHRRIAIAAMKKQTYMKANRVKNARTAINQPAGKKRVLITIKQTSR